jgi:carboxylate-amine ligase
MGIRFNPSPTRSLGVEVELGIVDADTGVLVPESTDLIADLLRHHPGAEEHPKAKHELFLSTIEIITGVCRTAADAHADLAATVAEVQEYLNPRGLALMGGGVHPFTDPHTLVRSPSERYDNLVNRIQWPARRLQIHGVHFHVGVGDADRAIMILNRLMGYLPHFIALSASSPYWEGDETGLASIRTKIFESLPTAGLPSRFDSWSEYESYVQIMLAANGIGSIREIWWDIRPHAAYGTLEFRMCDGMATLREAAALAALAQCLVEYLDAAIVSGRPPREPVGWVIRENKWRGARFGLDAILVDSDGSTVPLRNDIRRLLDDLAPTAAALDCTEQIGWVHEILDRGASYQRQRAIVAAGGSLLDVVHSLVAEFSGDRFGA